MKLTDKITAAIDEFYATLSDETDFDDKVEQVLDHLLDEEIVDLSEDEDGDMYEALQNNVFEYLETK